MVWSVDLVIYSHDQNTQIIIVCRINHPLPPTPSLLFLHPIPIPIHTYHYTANACFFFFSSLPGFLPRGYVFIARGKGLGWGNNFGMKDGRGMGDGDGLRMGLGYGGGEGMGDGMGR